MSVDSGARATRGWRWSVTLDHTLDPGVFLCFLLAFLLFQPLLQEGLPNTADGELHLYRAAMWRWAWDSGTWWPRWHTLLNGGYGSPLLNFAAPFPYLVVAAFSYATGDILLAFKGLIFLACTAYPLGMYLWARDLIGRAGGLLAAVAYTFASYRFLELYYQGNYAQFLSWSLYPWVLFLFRRLSRQPRREHFLLSVATLVALLMSHNIGAMLFFPFFAIYLLWQLSHSGGGARFFYPVAAALLSFGITAIFLVPALSERDYTRVQVLTEGDFSIAANVLSWRELVAPVPRLDERAMNPVMPYTFGRVHLLLAALGAATLLRRRQSRERRLHLIFALSGLLVTAMMMTSISLPLWQGVPLLAFAEFPSRFFGVGLLFSAFLTGAALLWLETRSHLQTGVMVVTSMVLLFVVASYSFARPFLYPDVSPQGMLDFERRSGAGGLTSANEFLPVWHTESLPPPAATRVTTRIGLVDPPERVEAEMLAWDAHTLRMWVTVAGDSEVPLTVAQLYFPGWQAWSGNRHIDLQPEARSGLIGMRLPPGEHDLLLRFGETPMRRLARWISLVSLATVSLLTLLLRQRRPQRAPLGVPRDSRGSLLFGAIVLALLFVRDLPVVRGWLTLASPPGRVLPASVAMDARVTPRISLLAYDLERTVASPGELLALRLYWQALEPVEQDLSSFVHLVAGERRETFAQSDALNPGRYPTRQWPDFLYVVDEHRIRLPETMPPVVYDLVVGLYDATTGERAGEIVLADNVRVLEREEPLPRTAVPLDVTFEGGITLEGYHIAEDERGVVVYLYWRASEAVTGDYQVFVHLLDASGAIISQDDGIPLNGLYPTSRWQVGQRVTDTHVLGLNDDRLPASLAVGLYELQTLRRLIPDGAGRVTIRDDTLHLPLPVSNLE